MCLLCQWWLQGNVTMRVLKDMFESVLELGPMSQVGLGQVSYAL
jgi:hypothetical protein